MADVRDRVPATNMADVRDRVPATNMADVRDHVPATNVRLSRNTIPLATGEVYTAALPGMTLGNGKEAENDMVFEG
eukprot:CAMPEP_0114552110 /NCGR_PEP_ID=MMETSP0114-20121206/6954_1 /TAXON_ID=31324 /ORGANISM="Goniomonas sp, Strain m" /LENGTH=75 /DNA_ID=CAMNT_0001736973 /DNA_START=29 /DNA_END=255 /DNA_ORIENTATION=-